MTLYVFVILDINDNVVLSWPTWAEHVREAKEKFNKVFELKNGFHVMIAKVGRW